jgi:soluble lytic murein transglycosylase-like protein
MTLPPRGLVLALACALAACSSGEPPPSRAAPPALAGPAEINRLIAQYAASYEVPEDLVHRVVVRESRYDPAARNGPYWGLMQIHPQTARTMGFRGEPAELLDAETNLRYAVRYLRGAWLVSGGDRDAAVMWYARGYYYEAKRLGLLEETGLRG